MGTLRTQPTLYLGQGREEPEGEAWVKGIKQGEKYELGGSREEPSTQGVVEEVQVPTQEISMQVDEEPNSQEVEEEGAAGQ